MDKETEKRLKELDEKREGEEKELIKQLKYRNYVVLHLSTASAIIMGLICAVVIQLDSEHFPLLLPWGFIIGFYGMRPQAVVRTHGSKTSRGIQIIVIGLALFYFWVSVDWV